MAEPVVAPVYRPFPRCLYRQGEMVLAQDARDQQAKLDDGWSVSPDPPAPDETLSKLSPLTDGMTWDRFMKGEIQIDHIKPCAEFDLTKEEEQRICFHYKNLQPLWELDNLKKGTKEWF